MNMELRKVRLGDIGKIVTGKTPSTKNEEFFSGDIPFITPEDIACGFRIDDSLRHLSQDGLDSIKSNSLNGFSVLVGCIGSDMGNVAYSEKKCATNQQINSITDINENFDPLFVYYLLSTKKNHLRQMAGSTTTPLLPKSVFESIEYYFPSFPEQKKIAAVLSALDDKIALNKKMNQKLEAMAKRLYDYWFVQFDFPDENGRPYKTSGGPMTHNETLNREIPEGWEVKCVNDVTSSVRGVSYSSDDEKKSTDTNVIQILRGNNISGSRFVFDSNEVFVSADLVQNEQKISKYDIVMTMSSGSKEHVGKSALALFDMPHSFGAFCSKFTPNENARYFIDCYLHSEFFIKYIRQTCSGTGINNLTNGHFDKAMFAWPSKKILDRFNEKLNALYERRGVIEREISRLTALRDKLLPLLMNGQVVVG